MKPRIFKIGLLFIVLAPLFFLFGGKINGAPTASPIQHYLYTFPDGKMYVYDMDNNFQLVSNTTQPTSSGIRGVVASPIDGMLYVSYGGAGGSFGNGSLLKYNLLTNSVVYTKSYNFGIDSLGITPDGKTIYMPSGEFSSSNLWYVINTSDGSVVTSIAAGVGGHNTVVSLDGKHVYMAGRNTPYLEVGDTSTNTNIESIGPLISGGRPFSVNGLQTLAFTTQSNYLGFQVSSITTGKVLYTVPINGFSSCNYVVPSHGISLSPNEKEVYVMDGCNSYVHVFDVSGLPGSAPLQVADIKLSNKVGGTSEPGCAYDCSREGWVLHSGDGRYVFVGDDGDVINTSTRQLVANVSTLYNTRKFIEIDWQNGQPIFTTNRYGLGYVTTPLPSPTPSPSPTVTPSPSPTPTSTLAQDTFQRPNQAHWGTASDGLIWGGDANTASTFSIVNNTGQVSGGNGTSYSATLGPVATNAEVLFTGSMSSYTNNNWGGVLRWKDGNNWYKEYINGGSLIVQKKVNGATTILGSVPFTATSGTSYTLRFRVVGTTLYARVWQTGTTEPTNWMITVTDTSFSSGFCGLRMLAQNGSTANYTSFQATAE